MDVPTNEGANSNLFPSTQGNITPEHDAFWRGFRDLFFARTDRMGRRLPDVISYNSEKPITGPWRYPNFLCKTMKYQGVNLNIIAMHLSGELCDDWDQVNRHQVMAQTYMAAPDGTAVCTAIDLDVIGDSHADSPEHFRTQDQALQAARKLVVATKDLSLTPHLEITKSAGYRVWIFHYRCPWAQARDLGLLLVQKAGLHLRTEVFPVSAPENWDGLGSAVFLPYWGVNARNSRQVMIDPDTETLRQAEEFVMEALAARTEPARLTEIVTAATMAGEIKATPPTRERRAQAEDDDKPLGENADIAAQCWQTQIEGCEALRDIAEGMEQSVEITYQEWLRLATHLRPYGDWGLAEFHRLSAFDGRYDEYQTDMLWESLQGGPTRCDKMQCGRHPQNDCGMADGKVSSVWFAYQGLKQLKMADEADDEEALLNRNLAILDLTDLGNCQRLYMRFGAEMRYSAQEKAWYIWSGEVWQKHGNEATAPMRKSATAMEMIKAETAALDEGDRHYKHAMRSQSSDRIKAALNLLRMSPKLAVNPNDWDRQPELVNVLNGTLDLRTQNLRQFDADDLMTAMMPVVYDAQAKCPHFERFIGEVVPDADLRCYVQKWIGYSLTGLTREQIFLFLFGSGQNGKSTLINIIKDIMGKQLHTSISSRTIMADQSGNKNTALAMVPFVEPRAVTMTEGGEGARFDEELIKAITGGDEIVARRHYELEFSFKPKLKLMIAANHKPKITGTDRGIWRRVRLVPFNTLVTKVDPDLPEKLAAEKSGILNWMLAGLAAYYREGLETPQAVLNATEEYQQDSDVLGQFLEENCVSEKKATLNGGTLYKTYDEWCDLNGYKPMANNTLANKLKDRGYEKGTGRERYSWQGIRLKRIGESLDDTFVPEKETTILEKAKLEAPVYPAGKVAPPDWGL